MRLPRAPLIVLAALGCLLAAAPAAVAATRYAEPGGNGPSATCPQADPCSIQNAVGLGVDNDVIHLLGGTYDLGGSALGVFQTLTIEPAPGASPVSVVNTGSTTFSVNDSDAAGTVIRGVRVAVHNSGGDAIHVNPGGNATFERLRVTATGTTTVGVQIEGTLRDSTIDFRGASSGVGVVTCCNGGSATLQNVTVVAAPINSTGIGVFESYGDPQDVTIRNTIARGGQDGIFVGGGSGAAPNTTATVSYSSFSSATEDALADSFLNLGPGNQTATPLFANAGAGDFRQLPGSPTIDRGTATGAGALDFEGQPRTQGPAPDIGADEATDPASLLTLATGTRKVKPTRTVTFPATCPIVDCNVAVAPSLVLKRARASAAAVVKLNASTVSLKAGVPGALTVTLKKKHLKRIRGARKAKLTVGATAIDALGFTGSAIAVQRFKTGRAK